MKLILTRFNYLTDRTLGTLQVEGSDVIFTTAELAFIDNKPNVSCIPCGEYELVRRWSKKHGHHLMLLNVPNRSYILIHSGNFASSFGKSDSKGCILLGEGFADIDSDGLLDVTDSKKSLKKLMDLVGDKEPLILKIWSEKMFKGKDGKLSSTKIMSFFGFFTFLIVSVLVVIYCPQHFDYRVFAVLSASSSAGMKIIDKYMNIKGGEE